MAHTLFSQAIAPMHQLSPTAHDDFPHTNGGGTGSSLDFHFRCANDALGNHLAGRDGDNDYDFLNLDVSRLQFPRATCEPDIAALPGVALPQGPRTTPSGGPPPSSSSNKRGSGEMASPGPVYSERGSNGEDDDHIDSAAAAAAAASAAASTTASTTAAAAAATAAAPSKKRARCASPTANNHASKPAAPKRVRTRPPPKAKRADEEMEEWEKYDGRVCVPRAERDGRNGGGAAAAPDKLCAVSLREMVESAVEVSLGGIRIYKAAGGPAQHGRSAGLVLLPPGHAVGPDVVRNYHLYFVVFAGKITVEIASGTGGGGSGGGAPNATLDQWKKVFGASPGTMVGLTPGSMYSLKNTSTTTAQIVYVRM